MPTRSAISEYTRAWFWPIEPTPMTPTRIGAATRPPKRARDINARRTRGVVEGFIFVRAFGRVVRCFDGRRSGVRETREPAQRVLDDLVQGDPVLLRQRGMPAQVRPQAGALSATRARSTSERSSLLIRPVEARHSKLRKASAGGMRDARMAGLAVARTAPMNAMPPRSSSRSHGMTKAAWFAKNRRYRSYDKATPRATPIAIPVSAMKESSNRNDFSTIDLRKPSARRAPVSWRRSTTLRIVMTPRPEMPTMRPSARYACRRLNTPIVVSRIWLMNSWMFSVINWYEMKYRSRSWPAWVTSTPGWTWK